jgi:iron complex transport system ATP-binding protein
VVSGLRVENLSFSYGLTPVLRGVSFAAPPAGVTALIGPNAAGKSTLFKCAAGLLRGQGEVAVDGRSLVAMERAEVNRTVAYLPQENPTAAVLTVFEAVLLARQHAGSWRVADEDLARVGAALEDLGIADLALRYLNELSGGQKQLISIAQALVRAPRVLLMDEPTSSLDLQRQLEVLGLVRRIARERDVTVVVALHDLNLAARHADHVLVLHDGELRAAGTPAGVLTPAMVLDVYGVEARVDLDPEGIPIVTALRSVREPAPWAAALAS